MVAQNKVVQDTHVDGLNIEHLADSLLPIFWHTLNDSLRRTVEVLIYVDTTRLAEREPVEFAVERVVLSVLCSCQDDLTL